jgi:hypothetical protein
MTRQFLPGGKREAVKFALSAHAKHGMPRANADKRESVEVALKELGNLNNAEAAKLCAVSGEFVRKVRLELQQLEVARRA